MVEPSENSRDCDCHAACCDDWANAALLMGELARLLVRGSQRNFYSSEAAAQTDDGAERCEGVFREVANRAASDYLDSRSKYFFLASFWRSL